MIRIGGFSVDLQNISGTYKPEMRSCSISLETTQTSLKVITSIDLASGFPRWLTTTDSNVITYRGTPIKILLNTENLWPLDIQKIELIFSNARHPEVHIS